MSTRSVQQVLAPPPPNMVGDGFRVHNFFPGGYDFHLQRMSPFFLLDYGSKIEFPPSAQVRGVGVHPHRGFETVTVAYYGRIAHHDSMGNSGVIGEGDVQWMTAGSGVLHKEYHEKEYSKTGGLFQMVQLWVNLPAKYKMTKPNYQELTKEKLGKYGLPDGGGTVEVIAGEYKGVKGAATTFSPVHLYSCRIKKGAVLDISFPSNYNTGLLVIEGSVKINGHDEALVDHFVLFRNDGAAFTLQPLEDAIILVLSGEPIDEPVVPYGPFVMNTKEEIMQAYDDFHKGKFGQLED